MSLPIVVLAAAGALRPPMHPQGDVAWPHGHPAATLGADASRGEDDQFPRKHTLYLNFIGGVLSPPRYSAGEFEENSAENISLMVPDSYVEWPAFAGGEQAAAAVAQAVAIDMADIGVRVAYLERPHATVPYTMAMVSGDAELLHAAPAGGYAAVVDCDAVNQRRVVYSFVDEAMPIEQANVVSQEAGHAWGLDHIFGADHVMSYEGFSVDKRFSDACTPLCDAACQGPGTIRCDEHHQEFCPPGQQNDMAELTALFGGPEPDLEPPEVMITTPADGATLASGDDLPILAEVADDYGGVGWKLTIEHDGEIVYDRVDYERRSEWYLVAPADGRWTLTVEAEDHADHVTTASVTVQVGEAGGNSSEGGEGSSSSAGPELDSSGEAQDGSSEAGSSGDAPGQSSDAGCGCSDTRGGTWLPLGVAVLAWSRRRRRH